MYLITDISELATFCIYILSKLLFYNKKMMLHYFLTHEQS